eukprot:CAMPEP_0194029738 /NCGR_PEP_ID=MMETSP0009_2-20130614/3397_1 /TAXON_ID=210454 /ORGANISM="Grammatophora oceanica, Strain CCMP 410" /LENGTH=726 /DNA_ID=CAMNT_0038669505 /DNA_START=41 /DNA_END=2218 /DNA_ORIENTATION=+
MNKDTRRVATQSNRRRITEMSSSFSMLLSVVLVCLSTVGASSFQENGILLAENDSMSTAPQDRLLRGNSGSSSSSSKPRQHVINRIYGEENASVRKAVSELEERMERSRTGVNGDPDHKLDYGDYHPYDPEVRRRYLAEGDNVEDVFQPMRIHFETEALDNERTTENAAKIDFIKSEILPRTSEFWTSALSVVPVKGNLFISTSELDNRMYCGDAAFTEVSTEHISEGVPDTDLILYVSGTPSSQFCSGSTLAVAVACNFDQFDRPTAGAINFCLDQIELRSDGTASESIIQDNVDVAIHEAAHVLGMSSNSYRFFWDSETGKPRTERQFTTSTVTCVDGQTRSLILPDENTMKFFLAENGQRYASIVTPKVQSVARNQFDCQSLAGAQLENQPTGSESCTGDHWDERLFYPEALSGVISPTTNILSHVTLALMEDSGWYKANFTMGRTSPWGLGAGCDFATSECLQPGNPPVIPEYSKGFFCSEGAERGCSPSLTHKMACTLIDYSYVNPLNRPDAKFQYFTDADSRGGPRQADYCPLFGSTYQGLDAEQLECANTDNVDSINFYNEVYGEDSKCFETSTGEGRCYRSACVKDEMAVKVNVRGGWHKCEYDFQEISVKVGGGALPATIVCPRLSTACPDLFCPFNCAGRGVCNFANVENGTVVPKCECFDETDTSPGCSDSLVPNGSFIADSGDLLNNLEEDFFDPLISVFVDHPDKWTTASWAW